MGERLYALTTHFPYYLFSTLRSETHQFIFGMLNCDFLALRFDTAGRFEGLESDIEKFNRASSEDVEAAYDRARDEFCVRRNCRDSKIQIQKFFIPRLNVGITELESTMEEFLSNPETFSEEEHREYPDLIAEWREAGQFCFYWSGNDYYVDAEGRVTSS